MSVRDTGWRRGTVRPWHTRAVGPFDLDARDGGEFDVNVNRAVTMAPFVPGDLESAKRAAEDALRTLCRDTLTALGDGDV